MRGSARWPGGAALASELDHSGVDAGGALLGFRMKVYTGGIAIGGEKCEGWW